MTWGTTFSIRKRGRSNADEVTFSEFLKRIEEKWQRAWEEAKVFEADPDPSRRKFFATFPFPYMNGPLHVGHVFTASRLDVYVRFKRMQGYNVLFPWAWHWTGQPLMGASERVARGDEAFIKVLREVDGVPVDELKKFADPIYMATYYTNESRAAVKRAGFSVDWRREFDTMAPTFQKFVEWQYESLRDGGYVVKGTHPVVWCPKCRSPTGDADRQVGEGVMPEEYTLIKFKLDDGAYLPAATFRPETVYGVTNMWVNPEADYVEAEVGGETWVVSEIAAGKLKEQGRAVEVRRKFKGRELVGRAFEEPIKGAKLLILPGWFVDPAQATGIVYSVPAHAPYDWLALKDLQEKPESLLEFGLDQETVKRIKPISIIEVEGFGDYPAVQITEQLGVKDQRDPKAEEATKLLYKREFHSGILKGNCMEYSGEAVREVKEKLIDDFKRRGIASSMYDLTKPVICRCLTPCTVKVLEDQWFLAYSDAQWKAKAKEALSGMKVCPEAAVQWFLTVIDWLKEWACVRRTGLGTPLPWSPDWVVETLSDSTVYMAFYTVNKHIRQYGIRPEALTRDVFDYVFRGKGDADAVAVKSGISANVLKGMRDEFLYWYPVDLRVSGKELVPNHLTFFIFHHVALFEPELWPKAVGVNGMLMIEGRQMHKSKGNFITMKAALNDYGADAMRCALLLAAEGMDDPNWRDDGVRDVMDKLESFYNFAKNVILSAADDERGHIERWLMSMLQRRIAEVTESLEGMRMRTALNTALFEVWNDFRWYVRRKGDVRAKMLKDALRDWVKMLAPFIPHLCEELWEAMGGSGFVSLSHWPTFDGSKVDVKAEEDEDFIVSLLDDTLNIIKATGVTPKVVCYYVAARWKWKAYLKVLERVSSGEVVYADLVKGLISDPDLRAKAGDVAKFVDRVLEEVKRMPNERRDKALRIGFVNEADVLNGAKDFLERELNAEVHVYNEEDVTRYDPKCRAQLAKPRRPAIYVE